MVNSFNLSLFLKAYHFQIHIKILSISINSIGILLRIFIRLILVYTITFYRRSLCFCKLVSFFVYTIAITFGIPIIPNISCTFIILIMSDIILMISNIKQAQQNYK